MNPSHAIRLVLLICTGLTSCAKDPAKPAEATPPKIGAEDPKLVGRIASIPADKRFVLIQSYDKWTIEAGTILTTRGPDNRVANLLVTGEALGEFAAADLQSGLAEVGDGVYLRHTPKAADLPAEKDSAPADTRGADSNL